MVDHTQQLDPNSRSEIYQPDDLQQTLVSDRLPARTPTIAPVAFPGYEIIGEVGRGGMGVVYRARQCSLNRLVALKVILGGPLASVEEKARFHIEAEAAARLHHPNIVQVYDVSEHAGFAYMALELIEGRTLRQWQNGQQIESKLAAKLVLAVARAIQHAHEQGILHRDLKPANILLAPINGTGLEHSADSTCAVTPTPAASPSSLLSSFGTTTPPLAFTPKVTDFGLAKPMEGGSDLTVTGAACGTPNYMAPEQVRGKAQSPGVDVYGLGAVLFELLTGRPPFLGTDAAEVMNQILRTEPQSVRKIVPGIPRDLAVIVAKCLEKEPGRRYLTARDLADDLDRYLAGKPITARAISTTERSWRWVKRNPVVASFLFLTTLGCVVTGALSIALARSEAEERRALAAANAARDEAESARDLISTALQAAEEARTAARQEAIRAIEQQQQANEARALAEDNLRLARGVIRGSMRELSRNPRFEDEDFRDSRLKLIDRVRQFRDTVAKLAPNTIEWLDDIADVSHYLGYLEYLNNNHDKAAGEYQRAAEAAGKWAELEPKNPESRLRQSYSLLNAGNALVNARRMRDAEQIFMKAIQLVEEVVQASPDEEFARRQAVDSYAKLANFYRIENNVKLWESTAARELNHARSLVRSFDESPTNLSLLAAAVLELAKAQHRAQKWDDADYRFTECVGIWEKNYKGTTSELRYAFEYASVLLTHANFLQLRSHHDRARKTYSTALLVLQEAQAAAPHNNAYCVDLAYGYSQYADFLRGQREFKEAETYYQNAIDLLLEVIRRAPHFRTAREVWAGSTIGRAHLLNQTGRHREAAAEWARLVKDGPDPRFKTRHLLFVMQSHVYAGDWKTALSCVEVQLKEEQPGWMWLDMARVCCIIVRQIDNDKTLPNEEQAEVRDRVLNHAIACLKRAHSAGEFTSDNQKRWFATNPDFDPVRGKFHPMKKE